MSVLSFATFSTMVWDKYRARAQKRRVPELILHALEAAGGWPGSLVAMALFNHKRSKLSYRVTLCIIVGLHVYIMYAYGVLF